MNAASGVTIKRIMNTIVTQNYSHPQWIREQKIRRSSRQKHKNSG